MSGIQSPYVFEQAIYNPQCFIQLVSDQYLSPPQWDTVRTVTKWSPDGIISIL